LTEDRGQPLPVVIPAEEISLRMASMTIRLVVAKEENWVLQAAVPSKGIRFELRELRRDEEYLYRSEPAERLGPPGLREVDIPFENDGLKFVGTLCVPRERGQGGDGMAGVDAGGGPFPTVLLLQGSGPLDRDGTIGPNTPIRDIAHGLAQRGVASFRFDKRTYLYAQQIDIRELTLDDELIRDAEAALRLLVEQPEVRADALFVLGHSLGGTAALLLEPPPPGLRGVVLMATKGRLFAEVLRSQIEYLAGLGRKSGEMPPEEEERTRATLEKLDALEAGVLPKDEVVLGMPVSYIEDVDRRDIAYGASRLGAPILILQGGKDYQVTEEDARILERWFLDVGVPGATATIFPELGHLFMPVKGEPGPDAYRWPGRVDGEVVDLVASWVEEQLK
jgi:dienelactone hydrolase